MHNLRAHAPCTPSVHHHVDTPCGDCDKPKATEFTLIQNIAANGGDHYAFEEEERVAYEWLWRKKALLDAVESFLRPPGIRHMVVPSAVAPNAEVGVAVVESKL